MNVKYRLIVGQDEFELNVEVKNEKELFEKLAFYSNLPKTAPAGATDLKLVFRTTDEGHKYYSLISELEQMEYKFGQAKDANGGGLFPKGWEKLFGASEKPAAPAPAAKASRAAVQVPAAPVQQAAPVAAPVQVPQMVTAPPVAVPQPVVAAPIPQPVTVPQPVAAPVQAAVQQPAATPAANPQVKAVANDVLARFGIKS